MSKADDEAAAQLGCGIFILLAWGLIIYAAIHFMIKLW